MKPGWSSWQLLLSRGVNKKMEDLCLSHYSVTGKDESGRKEGRSKGKKGDWRRGEERGGEKRKKEGRLNENTGCGGRKGIHH